MTDEEDRAEIESVDAVEESDSQGESPEPSVGAPAGTRISIGEIRRRAAENPDGPEADAARRIVENLQKGIQQKVVEATGLADLGKRFAAQANAALPTMPAVENLIRQQEAMAEHRAEMESAMESLTEATRARERRADAQAEATIETAKAQQRLQELQAQSIELATSTAEATAAVAAAQQEVLETIKEELDVLRDQHVTLQEQVVGQRRLLKSSWAGGVVMEWTLFVALIAAVATIVLGVVGGDEIPMHAWTIAGAVTGLFAVVLLLTQIRRKPRN